MSKTDKKAARTKRRERRAKRNAIAAKVTSHLIAPTFTKAQLAKLLDEYRRLQPKQLTEVAESTKEGQR